MRLLKGTRFVLTCQYSCSACQRSPGETSEALKGHAIFSRLSRKPQGMCPPLRQTLCCVFDLLHKIFRSGTETLSLFLIPKHVDVHVLH